MRPQTPLFLPATLVLLVALILLPVSSLAVTVADVTLPDTVEVDGRSLVLNGAGLRTKFFFKIYAGALYLREKSHDAETIIADPGPKQVIMHFIYDEVSAEKLAGGWREGFESNLSDEAFDALKARLATFNQLFPTVHKGDRIVLDFTADGRVRVRIGDELRGSIEGHDFQQALLRVWLGEEPADWDLREAMLGGED
ncbi:MAG TPA: hypothetical protein ENJ01_00670 [Gammaproteobacteria bacterium]|nr:hypothetical protein [Gammaproteobacteria bacterium]